jgi:hypothetical protein
MIFETEHHKLVLRPIWVIKGKHKPLPCTDCRGTGKVYEMMSDGLGCKPSICMQCRGTGESSLYDVPAPPPIDDKFRAALQEWLNNYKETDT